MTQFEQEFYLLLCMSGRCEEAIAYREKCEKREAERDDETAEAVTIIQE